ncbi:hypothetical protein P9E05_04935 [Bacillus mojavensis]|nr:hypothetical protein [Bacillus mojavensis]MEC1620791.1 hypothetical protein [Bacillus mojavensis]MEC1659693.1 hypothetical protein [Bacillus mojavensis]MEC1690862.1 hypothetical protein [Bacillus mojavensis]
MDTGAYALSFARYFLTSQPNEILSTAKPTDTGVNEQSGIILKNADNEMAVISLTMRAKMPKRGVVAGENGPLSQSTTLQGRAKQSLRTPMEKQR